MSSINNNHIKYMSLALDLAEKARGFTAPNPMVGCIIVQDGKIVGQGYHKQAGDKHAEVNAIEDAKNNNNIKDLSQSTAYVTLEPCCYIGKTGPCTEELIKHKISKIVVAMLDPNPLVAGKGLEKLMQSNIDVTLLTGLDSDLDNRVGSINQGFISRITRNKPFVRSKIAASLDGAVALNNGVSKWITNDIARLDVHKYRAHSDAIVTTANTVKADNPSLNSRLDLEQLSIKNTDYKSIKQPLRVVIDKYLDTSPNSQIYNLDSNCIVVTSLDNQNNTDKPSKLSRFKQLGIKLYYLPLNNNYFDLNNLWELLAELGCNDIMIEAGGNFNGRLIDANLVDEWLVYQSGIIMGPESKSMFNISNENNKSKDSMDNLFKLKCKHIKQLGDNWRLILN